MDSTVPTFATTVILPPGAFVVYLDRTVPFVERIKIDLPPRSRPANPTPRSPRPSFRKGR